MIFTLAYTQENINKAEELKESWSKTLYERKHGISPGSSMWESEPNISLLVRNFMSTFSGLRFKLLTIGFAFPPGWVRSNYLNKYKAYIQKYKHLRGTKGTISYFVWTGFPTSNYNIIFDVAIVTITTDFIAPEQSF